jgi:hypothetical protein
MAFAFIKRMIVTLASEIDTLDIVAKLPECTGKIAVQGYYLGALMTFLMAVRCRRCRRRLSRR